MCDLKSDPAAMARMAEEARAGVVHELAARYYNDHGLEADARAQAHNKAKSMKEAFFESAREKANAELLPTSMRPCSLTSKRLAVGARRSPHRAPSATVPVRASRPRLLLFLGPGHHTNSRWRGASPFPTPAAAFSGSYPSTRGSPPFSFSPRHPFSRGDVASSPGSPMAHAPTRTSMPGSPRSSKTALGSRRVSTLLCLRPPLLCPPALPRRTALGPS